MKLKLFLTSLAIISVFNVQSQSEDADTDAKYFFSGLIGANFTQFYSSGDIFSDTTFGNGYTVGVQFNLFPDYEFSHLYLRVAAAYSNEQSKANSSVIVQNESVSGEVNLNMATIELFMAYRFATDTKIDAYLGGGFQFQQKLNSDDSAYIFRDVNGNEKPIFDNTSVELPLRFQTTGPNASIGPVFELGAFIPIGKNLLNIGTGLAYGFLITNSSAKLKFEKTNLYINASYQLF